MPKAMIEIAKELTAKKWSLIPVKIGSKKPSVKWLKYQTERPTETDLLRWFQETENNIGLVTGALSGVLVIDCDTVEAGREFYKILRNLKVENTLRVETGRGLHFYFQYREGVRNDAGKALGKGIDIRGEGGYVLIPPSVHPNGKAYKWFPGPIHPLPDELYHKVAKQEVAENKIRIPEEEMNGAKVVTGERNQTLTSMAGAMRKVGFDERGIYSALMDYNSRTCVPPLPEGEVKTITQSICRYANEQKIREPVTVNMADVEVETVTWLWQNRIPIGKLTLIEGDGGLGKSYFTLRIAAMVSNGDFGKVGKAILMSAEDGLGDTIRPRLTLLHANLHNVIALTGFKDYTGEKAIGLRDLPLIESMIVQHRPKLLVIDPVISFMAGKNTNHAGEVRSMLAPLANMAMKYGLAVIMVRHLNKNADAKAVYRGQGSADFINASRSAFLVARHPENDHTSVICHTKSNLGPIQKTLEFWIGEDGGLEIGEESYITADQALAGGKK